MQAILVIKCYKTAVRGVLRSAEKKTQSVKPDENWVHGLWENVVYVSANKGREQHKKCTSRIIMEKRGKHDETRKSHSDFRVLLCVYAI
jgi:REP element-mobilizing transposase RayT